MTQNQNRNLRFGLPGIISLLRSPFSFVFFLVVLPRFALEQFFLGYREHLAHGVIEPLKLCLAGNVRSR